MPARPRRRATPRGLRPATWSGSGCCSTPGGRSCRGREAYGGRDASLMEWLIFEEEYYRAGRPAARHPERHLPARAHAVRVRHRRSSRTASCPQMAAAEETWCQGWSEPNAGSDLAGIKSRRGARRRRRRLAAHRPEDVDDTRRVLRPPVRPVPHRPRGRAPPRPDVLPRRPAGRGRDRAAASGASTATRASPRCSSRTCSCPTRDVLGGVNEGWRSRWPRPARSAASRCAAPAASWPRPTGWSTSTARTRPGRPDAARRRSCAAWMDAEAYRWQTFWTVTTSDGGRARPARSRAWSSCSGRSSTCACTQTALRAARPATPSVDGPTWMKGCAVRAGRARSTPGTNEIQRNVVAERVLGPAPAVAR